VAADVTSEEEVAHVVDTVVDRFGRLDCAHNNVGINGRSCRSTSTRPTTGIIAINLSSVFYGMKQRSRRSGRRDRARREHVVVRRPGRGALVEWVRRQQARGHRADQDGGDGVRACGAVNAVCPGSTDTQMIQDYHQGDPALIEAMKAVSPMRRLAEPSEIAAAVVWLCSDQASFVNGHALSVDGGAVIQ
jgi:NAD(P)-dependent dehydrogenase (short-subunit alcohol dehydrogenase family)